MIKIDMKPCKANPIYTNIEGLELKIGNKVKILPSEDDTFCPIFIGDIGKIIYFEYSCGCGQTYPNDPMIGVEFENGMKEEFWKEELKVI